MSNKPSQDGAVVIPATGYIGASNALLTKFEESAHQILQDAEKIHEIIDGVQLYGRGRTKNFSSRVDCRAQNLIRLADNVRNAQLMFDRFRKGKTYYRVQAIDITPKEIRETMNTLFVAQRQLSDYIRFLTDSEMRLREESRQLVAAAANIQLKTNENRIKARRYTSMSGQTEGKGGLRELMEEMGLDNAEEA